MRLIEIHLEVSNLETSFNFYRQLFPYKQIVQFKNKDAYVLILEDGSAFGIWLKGKVGLFGGKGGEHVHYAFNITTDEYPLYLAKLKKMQTEYFEHEWDNGAKSVYFFDADGHQGEFITCDWLELHKDRT